MKKILLAILAIIILLGLWFLMRKETLAPVVTPDTNTASTTPVVSDEIVVVDAPAANSLITSPLSVSGKAKGTWYFEASAPFEVTDASGAVLGQSHIEATADWMTVEYVPFKGTVSFTEPKGTSTTGFVVFKNDNPSGDPARDKSLKIPVRFK